MVAKGFAGKRTAFLAVAAALLASTPLWALTITPTFDSSITSDPNSAAILATINSAINTYQTAFSDPINVAIEFHEMNTGLGSSSTWIYTLNYTTVRPRMTTDATTADDATAIANTPNTANNPVNNNALINIKTANIRALGIPGSFPPGDAWDGKIGLNTAITFPPQPSAGNYSLLSVTEHEIDEVLGLGSMLPSPFNNAPEVEDLFRFTAGGSRTFTTGGDDAYFSIDGGATDLARFNQNAGGDYGDWWSTGAHTAQVQDAFGSPGATPSLGVELRALDVIGYDLVSVPEPASLGLLGVGALGLIGRRRKA